MAAGWILNLGLLLFLLAIILLVLGFIGRIAWTIGKWLIILCLVLAFLFGLSAIL